MFFDCIGQITFLYLGRDVLKSGRGILAPGGHVVHQKQVRIRRTEHNKLNAGQMCESCFGLLALVNTNDWGHARADERGPLRPSKSVYRSDGA